MICTHFHTPYEVVELESCFNVVSLVSLFHDLLWWSFMGKYCFYCMVISNIDIDIGDHFKLVLIYVNILIWFILFKFDINSHRSKLHRAWCISLPGSIGSTLWLSQNLIDSSTSGIVTRRRTRPSGTQGSITSIPAKIRWLNRNDMSESRLGIVLRE